MLKLLSNLFGKSDKFKTPQAASIDVSSPEYERLRPSIERTSALLRETGVLKSEDIAWCATLIREGYTASCRSTLNGIVRDGDLLQKVDLKALGLRANRKVGQRFVSRLATDDVSNAINAIENTIRHATSEASQLFDLERYERLGITHVTLSPAGDERDTEIEREYDGRKLSLAEARKLIGMHGLDIARSIFQPELNSLLDEFER